MTRGTGNFGPARDVTSCVDSPLSTGRPGQGEVTALRWPQPCSACCPAPGGPSLSLHPGAVTTGAWAAVATQPPAPRPRPPPTPATAFPRCPCCLSDLRAELRSATGTPLCVALAFSSGTPPQNSWGAQGWVPGPVSLSAQDQPWRQGAAGPQLCGCFSSFDSRSTEGGGRLEGPRSSPPAPRREGTMQTKPPGSICHPCRYAQ